MSDMNGLGIRARNALRNLNVKTPSDLDARAAEDGNSVVVMLHGIPNCGRKSVKEILEWFRGGAAPALPAQVWVRMELDDRSIWCARSVSLEPREGNGWMAAYFQEESK